MFRTLTAILIPFVLLVACTAAPTPTPVPTATPAPTNTPLPTATPVPTSTPLPTATPTATATSTSKPTATATATSTPTPDPIKSVIIAETADGKRSVVAVTVMNGNQRVVLTGDQLNQITISPGAVAKAEVRKEASLLVGDVKLIGTGNGFNFQTNPSTSENANGFYQVRNTDKSLSNLPFLGWHDLTERTQIGSEDPNIDYDKLVAYERPTSDKTQAFAGPPIYGVKALTGFQVPYRGKLLTNSGDPMKPDDVRITQIFAETVTASGKRVILDLVVEEDNAQAVVNFKRRIRTYYSDPTIPSPIPAVRPGDYFAFASQRIPEIDNAPEGSLVRIVFRSRTAFILFLNSPFW